MLDQILLKKLLLEFRKGLDEIYGSRLKGFYLFGSYARGQAENDSDVDVLIVLDQFQDRYGAEVDLTGFLASDLSLKYGITISRVFETEKDWSNRESSFLYNVRQEAIAA